MKIIPNLAILASTVFLLSSCSKKEESVEVNVDAFVVLKSGDNIKLGLMEVGAIERDQCIDELKAFLTKRDQEIDELNEESRIHNEVYQEYLKSKINLNTSVNLAFQDAKMAERSFKYAINSAENKRVSAIIELVSKDEDSSANFGVISGCVFNKIDGLSAFDLSGQPQKALDLMNSNSNWDKHLKQEKEKVVYASNEYLKTLLTLRQLQEKKNKLNEVPQFFEGYNRLQNLKSAHSLFEELPKFTASKKTNADGLCKITLPKGGDWVMCSKFTRLVGNEKEDYFWIVLQNTSESDNSLTLSNDNMIVDDQIPMFLYQK